MPTFSPFSVTVPGLVAGLNELHRKFGSIEFSELRKDPISFAENGFPVYWSLSRAIEFGAKNFADEGFRKSYLINGRPPKVGEILKQKNLAEVLKSIACEGPDVFYNGWIAEEIANYLNRKEEIFQFQISATLNLNGVNQFPQHTIIFVSTKYRLIAWVQQPTHVKHVRRVKPQKH